MNDGDQKQGQGVAATSGGTPDGNQDDRALLLQVLAELRLLRDRISEGVAFQKPILTLDEASRMLGVSRKRMENIIHEENARLGRMPDFVCDARGTIRRHVLRDEFIEWAKARRPRRGRPSKTERKPLA
jgi:hypothetical protein